MTGLAAEHRILVQTQTGAHTQETTENIAASAKQQKWLNSSLGKAPKTEKKKTHQKQKPKKNPQKTTRGKGAHLNIIFFKDR